MNGVRTKSSGARLRQSRNRVASRLKLATRLRFAAGETPEKSITAIGT
jgi:hypothetical protein